MCIIDSRDQVLRRKTVRLVSDCDCPEFRDEIPLRRGECKTQKFQFLEKGQNCNFDYKIIISVKKKVN